jgi:excisionase family DNA binding protein
MLGVNPATLRSWTAVGKLRVYRTPGGHRRFSAAELAAFSKTEDFGEPDVASDVIVQLRSRYRALAHSPAAHQGWLAAIEDPARRRFHDLGDQLLDLLGEYLGNPAPRPRQRALERAREIGRQYGELARSAAADVSQAVEAYLLFRRPVLDVLSSILMAHAELASQLSHLMRDAERIMDEVLVGMTDAGVHPAHHVLVERAQGETA